jgi:hypothetical protein
VSVFPFIEAEKAEQRNVAKACCLLEVSRSAFYEWHKHLPSARQLADHELAQRIQAIWEDSKGTYGWPRVHRQLRRDGVHVSRKRVARIMRHKGLIGRCRRRWTQDHHLRPRGGRGRSGAPGVRSGHHLAGPGLCG